MTEPKSLAGATARRLISLVAALSLVAVFSPARVSAVDPTPNPAAGYDAAWTVTGADGLPRTDGKIAVGDDLQLTYAAVDGTAITSCGIRLSSAGGRLMQTPATIVDGACALTIRLPDFPDPERRAATPADSSALDLCVVAYLEFADVQTRAMTEVDQMQPGGRICSESSVLTWPEVLDFPIEPGGTPRPFVSDPQVLSWNPADWGTGMTPLTFGTPWHYQAPAWLETCLPYLNGEWQTNIRPARPADCQPWDLRLPGVLPSTLPWSGGGGDWAFELVTDYTAGVNAPGAQTITEMRSPIAPSDTVFESSLPAVFPVDLATTRFVTVGQPWQPVFQLSGGSDTACTLILYTWVTTDDPSPGDRTLVEDHYEAAAGPDRRCTFDVPAMGLDEFHQYHVTAGVPGGITYGSSISAIPAPEPPTIEPPTDTGNGETEIGVEPGDGQGLGLDLEVVADSDTSAAAVACQDSALSTNLDTGGAIPHLDAQCALAPGTYVATATMVDAAGIVITSTRSFSVAGPPVGTTYKPITPLRVLDTRSGVGLTSRFTANIPRTFNVAGTGTIPANAVAITGNVTVTGQTAGGYLSVGPTKTASPTSSTINFPLGDNRANNLTLPLDANGDLSAVYKAATGSRTQLIVDVTGYFLANDTGARYKPLTAARILDSRFATGLAGTFLANTPRTFQVTGVGGVPAGATAVTGNLTVVGQTKAGYVSLTPTPQATPLTSTINFPLGDTRANGVTVPLSSAGKLSAVYKASGGSTNLIFDVTGYYLAGTSGLRFYPLSPGRIMDTRSTTMTQLSGRFASSVPRTLVTGGHAGVPANAVAVSGNLTVVGQTRAGYVSITKTPTATPPVSTINFPFGDVRANGVTVPLNSANDMALVYKATAGAKTHLILDLTGYFR